MRKTLCALLAVLLFVSVMGTGFAAVEPMESIPNADMSDTVIQAVKDWFYPNYGEFYNIIDEEFVITRTHDTGTATNYTVFVFCRTSPKAESVEDLPFVQGMRNELEVQAAARSTNYALTEVAVNNYLAEIDFSHDYEVLTLDIVVSVNHDARSTATTTLYFQDGATTSLYPIDVANLDSSEMYAEGQSAVEPVAEAYMATAMTRGLSTYDRIAARDYALKWTGENITQCYDDGTSCKVYQDRTKWNNEEYPYISTLKHSDCADFVSQCVHEGGIPVEEGKWERFKDGNAATNPWAWTGVTSLPNYMTSKGYWDESTFELANAGNIICWPDYHIGLITLNDTMTHRYTAHTNDRYDRQFVYSTTHAYYMINGV